MADISKITLPSGTTYDIKDAVAREAIAKGFSSVIAKDAATTPQGVKWMDGSTEITGTLVASETTKGTFYLVKSLKSKSGDVDIYDEYITTSEGTAPSITYAWEKLGNTQIDIDDLGDLAYKDTAATSYAPAGTVSAPTFTGTQGAVSVSGTPTGTISVGTGTANYTPAGTVTKPGVTVSPTTVTKYVAGSANGGGSVTAGSAAECTLPSLTTSVTDEILTLGWTAGTFTANTPTTVTLPTFAEQTITTAVAAELDATPTFTGTGAELQFTGASLTSTGNFTPEGTNSSPVFDGTMVTITVS